ncbi:MAG: response regulator transcription factor [Bryobacteraceae bacterium]|nr:response regulator transcription factor [Bryobacteraceae bacterium]
MAIRILLVDDHAMFCGAAARALTQEPDFEMVGHVDTVDAALEIAGCAQVDLVLLDYDLDGQNGLEFIREAAARGFACRILLLSAAIPDPALRFALSEGARGLVLKSEPLDRLFAAIRAVHAGNIWLDDEHWQIAVLPRYSVQPFTERERWILSGIVEGLSNKEIGALLEVPETTVKFGLQTLFNKTGTRTRGGLVRLAIEKYRYLLVALGH